MLLNKSFYFLFKFIVLIMRYEKISKGSIRDYRKDIYDINRKSWIGVYLRILIVS